MIQTMRTRAAGKLVLVATTAVLALGGHAARADAALSASELPRGDQRPWEETLPTQLSGGHGNRIHVVTSEEIQFLGLADVGQVLSKYVPGLYLAPQSGAFSYNFASLQGSRSNEILYLIDGVRISNRLYNTTPPLDTVPAHMVDRIEVLDGGQGLFFGTQAVAGVINIVTRPFTDGRRPARLAIGGDTNDSVFTANGLSSSGSISANQLVAYASCDESKRLPALVRTADYQPTGTDRHRGYRLTSAGLKYAYDFSNDVRVSASYQHTQGYVDFARPTDAASAVNNRNEDIATAKVDWTVNDATQLLREGLLPQLGQPLR